MRNKRYHSVGLIPFKEKSERVPGKNFRPLGGKPLWHHIVDNALESNLDAIFISTNSEKAIEEINAMDDRVQSFDCPPWYFESKTTGDRLLTYPAESIDSDIYVQLFATAPFLKPQTINKAIDVLDNSNEYDSVFTMTKHHEWVWYKGQPITYFPGNLPRSQDAEPIVIETTGLYAMTADALNKYKRRVGNQPYMLEVGHMEAHDIDYESDWQMAEMFHDYELREGCL